MEGGSKWPPTLPAPPPPPPHPPGLTYTTNSLDVPGLMATLWLKTPGGSPSHELYGCVQHQNDMACRPLWSELGEGVSISDKVRSVLLYRELVWKRVHVLVLGSEIRMIWSDNGQDFTKIEEHAYQIVWVVLSPLPSLRDQNVKILQWHFRRKRVQIKEWQLWTDMHQHGRILWVSLSLRLPEDWQVQMRWYAINSPPCLSTKWVLIYLLA